MQQKNMCCYKKSMSCRKFVIRHLRIFVSDGMANEREESRRSRIETLRDDRPLLNNGNGAFTLIELLVVVLIIGILAAVALPQYQKAVEKSKAAQAITLLRSTYDSAKAYQLANGSWPSNFDTLAIDIPWTGTANGVPTGQVRPGKSNTDWSLQFQIGGDPGAGVRVSRLKGTYQGAAFGIYFSPEESLPADKLLCIEFRGNSLHPFTPNMGNYCRRIFKASRINTPHNGSEDFFLMP